MNRLLNRGLNDLGVFLVVHIHLAVVLVVLDVMLTLEIGYGSTLVGKSYFFRLQIGLVKKN